MIQVVPISEDEMPYRMIYLLMEIKQKGKTTKIIRCDNSGENRKLRDLCKQMYPRIIFEFTPPGTPQHNDMVERPFASIFGKIRATLNETRVDDELRTKLWTECANTVTNMDNITANYN